MTRGTLPAGLLTALQASHVTSFVLVDLLLDAGTQYLTSAPHDVDYGGHTYTSAQGIGSIEPATETEAGAQGLTFTLSGVPQSAIAAALTEPVQGRSVVVRLAVVSGTTLYVDDAVWSGALDVMQVTDSAAPQVRVTAEHALIAWQQPSGLLFSDADQQLVSAGDKFFEFAAQMVDATIVWPAKEFFRR